MRVLLVAYEFPPSSSPQSLRWMYLSSHLARQGVEMHVMAPDIPGAQRDGELAAAGVTVHRVNPGPLRTGLASVRQTYRRMKAVQPVGVSRIDVFDALTPEHAPGSRGLNWRGKLAQTLDSLAGVFLYPDIRGEWLLPARRMLTDVLSSVQPDVVVASHEPATALELGLLARQQGYPLVADLGDPVLAHYTPTRWRRRAARLEAMVAKAADALVTTNCATKRLLVNRYDVPDDRVTVITQGFESGSHVREVGRGLVVPESDSVLHLVYTGSFYAFRSPDQLIEAIIATPGVSFTVAARSVPTCVSKAARENPDKVRWLGLLEHADALQLQQRADVLVNLANDDPVQTPGKVYEYLGAGRPILHVGGDMNEDVASLIAELGAGTCCDNTAPSIAQSLISLAEAKQTGTLSSRFVANRAVVSEYAWSTLAARYLELITAVADGGALAQANRNSGFNEEII